MSMNVPFDDPNQSFQPFNQFEPNQPDGFEQAAEPVSHSGWKQHAVPLLAVAGLLLAACATAYSSRYRSGQVTQLRVQEFDHLAYGDDPAQRNNHHACYNGRNLLLKQVDETHFDFEFTSREPHVASVVFKNVDVSLMTPALPENCKTNRALRLISMTDREWNRQQVQFDVPGEHVEVTGGDGWEEKNLKVASLAKNCLNAGLWEVLLFTESDEGKELYYQGWFSFPLGQYKRIWESNMEMSYWNDSHFWRMEHWVNPEGLVVDVDLIRDVESSAKIPFKYDPSEEVWHAGEQVRKRRTSSTPGVRTWSDLIERRNRVRFASFRPPGVYDNDVAWGNRYELIANLEGIRHRRVRSMLNDEIYDELVVEYTSDRGESIRFLAGGLNLDEIPELPKERYNEGLYLPMGIGTPPFYQSYADLVASPPHESPYYSFVLNEEDQWIDHHSMAIDGPVLHRDQDNPDLVHLYLLSYERHQVVQHYELTIPKRGDAAASDE